MDEFERLVDDYRRQASEAVTRLQAALERSDLLRGWATGEIAKNGAIPGGVTYSFHGIGCRIDLEGLELEVDFSPTGRFDGFDAWRLFCLARQFPERYPSLQSRAAIELQIARSADLGAVSQSESACSFWFREADPTSAA